MPKSLADRIAPRPSSQFKKVYHPPTPRTALIDEVDAVRHQALYSELPVRQQVTKVVERHKWRRGFQARERARYERANVPVDTSRVNIAGHILVPLTFHAPLPPPPPSLPAIPLVDRITTPPRDRTFVPSPIITTLDFSRKTPAQQAAVIGTKHRAVVRRIQPLFEKNVLDLLEPEEQRQLQVFGNIIDWIGTHLDQEIQTEFTGKQRESVAWGLAQVGHVSFKSLRRRISKVVRDLGEIRRGGYFEPIRSDL